MKILILGNGSIGRRYNSILTEKKIDTTVVDIQEFPQINEIITQPFDAVMVCTPTHLHLNHIEMCVNRGVNVFCEKPLFHIYPKTRIDNLLQTVTEKNLITMVGCNLRFTPEVESIPENTPYIKVYFGYDIRKWRPSQPLTTNYGIKASTGGGILLDAIHELDYLTSKFGEIKDISISKLKVSNITVDVEDIATGRILFENGTIADFHLNYLSENYQRYFEYLDSNHTLKKVDFHIAGEMYEKQVDYFLQQLSNKEQCMNSFAEATKLLSKLL